MAEAGARTRQQRVDLVSFLVGFALATLTALTLLTAWGQGLEDRAVDFLFVHGRRDPPRAHPAIVHVDIDDGALTSVGAWPWPRSRLADAIRILDQCGARVIALDILIDKPKEPAEDAALADAMKEARAQVLLAVNLVEGKAELGPLWRGRAGAGAFRNLVTALRKDIRLSTAEVLRRTGIRGARALRVAERPLAFKRFVVESVAEELAKTGELTEDRLVEALVPLPPGERRLLGEFLERKLFRQAIQRYRTRTRMAKLVPGSHSQIRHHAVEGGYPIPVLAEHAASFGFVAAFQDADGHVRRLPLWIGHKGGAYPQLGLAAAAAYLGVPLNSMLPRSEGVSLGDATLPLAAGLYRVSWPRIDKEYGAYGLMRQADEDTSTAGHVSIGVPVRLAEVLRAIETKERRLWAVARELRVFAPDLAEALNRDRPAPETLEALEDEISFFVEEVREAVRAGEKIEDAQLADKSKALLEFALLRETLPGERAQVESDLKRLQERIQGKLVFVGWTATSAIADFYPTVADERTPGVVVHAMIANAALTGNVIETAPLWAEILAALLLGGLGAFTASRRGPALAVVLTLAYGGFYAATNAFVIFDRLHMALAPATPLIALFAGWAGASATRLMAERRERARLTRQFGARIHKRLFDHLLDNPDVLDLKGETREVTCFFSDLAGFTSISEGMNSKQTVALLNQYMAAMNHELTEHFAYVNKFLGDGIMAVWGAFAQDELYAQRGCEAAIDCARRMLELNEHDWADRNIALSMRMGLATGKVVVGDCGAPPALRDFTVIGDSANLAARLESANKQFGTKILIDGRTRKLVSDELLSRPLGRITVAGQTTPTEIHELLGRAGTLDPSSERRMEMTADAVRLFQEGDFEASRRLWQELAGEFGDEKLAAVYTLEITRLTAYRPKDFDGVIRLRSK